MVVKLKERRSSKNYDVVIVGAGLAGVCAAIACARHGARTALINNRPMLGGNASSEIRLTILGASCFFGSEHIKENAIETGIVHELVLENVFRNPNQSYALWDMLLWEKTRYQEGLDIYLNTHMIDAICEDDMVKSITCCQLTTEKTIEFSADIFIDATGHATLGFLTGAEYRTGSESKYEFNEPSAPEEGNEYKLGNSIGFQTVDMDRPVVFKKPFWARSLTEEDLKYREHLKRLAPLSDDGTGKLGPNINHEFGGYWWVQAGGDHDDIIADAEEIREDLMKLAFGVWDHMKNDGNHGIQNQDWAWNMVNPGTRESRRLVGDYLLNENDIRTNRIFDDAVAYGGWPLDVQNPLWLNDLTHDTCHNLEFDGVYTIPYRCYYSRNIKNLMMAGRDISVTKMAFGSTRVQGTCAVGGQAVGTAAALAIKYGCSPREVSSHMDELQQILLMEDCYIPGFRNNDKRDMALNAKIKVSSELNGKGADKLNNGVTRDEKTSENCWESDGISGQGESIIIELGEVRNISQIRLTFDSNLSKHQAQTMPSRLAPPLEVSPELIKDYEVSVFNGEKAVWSKRIEDNYQRLNVIDVPEGTEGEKVCVKILATNGYPNARVFEVRVY